MSESNRQVGIASPTQLDIAVRAVALDPLTRISIRPWVLFNGYPEESAGSEATGFGDLEARFQRGDGFDIQLVAGSCIRRHRLFIDKETPDRVTVRVTEDLPFLSTAPITTAFLPRPAQSALATDWSRASAVSLTWQPGNCGELFLFLRDVPEPKFKAVLDQLHLVGPSGDVTGLTHVRWNYDTESACGGMRVLLDPGYHRLRWHGPDGRVREQGVVAIQGWQSQLFLACRDAEGEAVGVAPDFESAAWLASPRDRGFVADDRANRACELTRYALGHGEEIPTEVLQRVVQFCGGSQPMLVIQAAYLVIENARRAAGDLTAAGFAPAADILEALPRAWRRHPDAVVIRLGNRALGGAAFEPSQAGELSVPPLLAVGWDVLNACASRWGALLPYGHHLNRISVAARHTGCWLNWDSDYVRPPAFSKASFTLEAEGSLAQISAIKEWLVSLEFSADADSKSAQSGAAPTPGSLDLSPVEWELVRLARRSDIEFSADRLRAAASAMGLSSNAVYEILLELPLRVASQLQEQANPKKKHPLDAFRPARLLRLLCAEPFTSVATAAVAAWLEQRTTSASSHRRPDKQKITGIKHYKPTSAGRRAGMVSDFADCTYPRENRPEKALLSPKKKKGGRNFQGVVTSRFRGGGHKQRYRTIDFKRVRDNVEATVIQVEYDPNRTARIALLEYPKDEKYDHHRTYIIAPTGLKAGDKVMSGDSDAVEPKVGNCMPLWKVPLGMTIHNIELTPGKGAQICRSAGCGAVLTSRDKEWAQLTMPSGEIRRVSSKCRATIGSVSHAEHMNISIGKAGRVRWKGRKPHNRGTSQNPTDHPLGGGEGRTKGGRDPCSPTGVLAKGGKTRHKRKPGGKAIIRRRPAGRFQRLG